MLRARYRVAAMPRACGVRRLLHVVTFTSCCLPLGASKGLNLVQRSAYAIRGNVGESRAPGAFDDASEVTNLLRAWEQMEARYKVVATAAAAPPQPSYTELQWPPPPLQPTALQYSVAVAPRLGASQSGANQQQLMHAQQQTLLQQPWAYPSGQLVPAAQPWSSIPEQWFVPGPLQQQLETPQQWSPQSATLAPLGTPQQWAPQGATLDPTPQLYALSQLLASPRTPLLPKAPERTTESALGRIPQGFFKADSTLQLAGVDLNGSDWVGIAIVAAVMGSFWAAGCWAFSAFLAHTYCPYVPIGHIICFIVYIVGFVMCSTCQPAVFEALKDMELKTQQVEEAFYIFDVIFYVMLVISSLALLYGFVGAGWFRTNVFEVHSEKHESSLRAVKFIAGPVMVRFVRLAIFMALVVQLFLSYVFLQAGVVIAGAEIACNKLNSMGTTDALQSLVNLFKNFYLTKVDSVQTVTEYVNSLVAFCTRAASDRYSAFVVVGGCVLAVISQVGMLQCLASEEVRIENTLLSFDRRPQGEGGQHTRDQQDDAAEETSTRAQGRREPRGCLAC